MRLTVLNLRDPNRSALRRQNPEIDQGGLSSSRDNGIEAEVNDEGEEDEDEDEDGSDEEFRSTKQAIFEAVRKDLMSCSTTLQALTDRSVTCWHSKG